MTFIVPRLFMGFIRPFFQFSFCLFFVILCDAILKCAVCSVTYKLLSEIL